MSANAWRIEVTAGITTFLTMAYIVVVNPTILSTTGMPFEDVFFATCIASAASTLIMALLAKLPFALAPGMGLNAFFAYTVCGALGIPWQTALAAVFVSGIAFLVLSLTGLRTAVARAVPPDLIRAIAAGIGLFIAFIGLVNGGIVVDHPATLVTLGDLTTPTAIAASAGLLITVSLTALRIPGGILLGIGATGCVAVLLGLAPAPETLIRIPSLPRATFFAAFTAFPRVFDAPILPVLFTMLFLDLFDTMGTLFALGHASSKVDEHGRLPNADKAFMADAGGTIIGSLLGTSTVTTYIESAAGIAVGGRTYRTAVVVAALFLATLPFLPLIAATPTVATAPALVVVGALMFKESARIAWKDPAVAPAAMATMLVMPATYNISNGIGAGFILYAAANLVKKRFDRLTLPVIVISILFVLYFVYRPGG